MTDSDSIPEDCVACGLSFSDCTCDAFCEFCGGHPLICECVDEDLELCEECGETAEDCVCAEDREDDGMTDAEADADTFRSCGWGTDEDYGYFGGDEDF